MYSLPSIPEVANLRAAPAGVSAENGYRTAPVRLPTTAARSGSVDVDDGAKGSEAQTELGQATHGKA
jgi:hypothetical protein